MSRRQRPSRPPGSDSRHRKLRMERLEERTLLAADLTLLKDINSTPSTGGSRPANFVEVGSVAFFTAASSTHGTELWKSDGTTAGTSLVKEIFPWSQG